MKKITLYASLLLLLPATYSLHAMSLWDAAEQGNCDKIKKLIQQEKGIDINQADTNGYTPLYLAAKNGHTKVVELLLKHGADINKTNNYDTTPLLMAIINNRIDIVQLLLEHSADINQADKEDTTPLHWAAINDHTEAVQLLLKNGADINKADNYGCTPLHWAAINGRTEAIQLLVKHGADTNKANKLGETPLAVATPEARKIMQKPVITLLLGHHARCGVNSLLTQLPPFVLHDIAQLANAMAYGK
jgi:ankyrin repeat protein